VERWRAASIGGEGATSKGEGEGRPSVGKRGVAATRVSLREKTNDASDDF
jgi:hypothetical protein